MPTRTVRLFETDVTRIEEESRLHEDAPFASHANDVLGRVDDATGHGGAQEVEGGGGGRVSRPLPFSDRVVFAVRGRPRTAKGLSRLLGKDLQDVYKVLEGLEDRGVVRRLAHEGPTRWMVPEGVEVDYRSGREESQLRVTVDGEDPRGTEASGADGGAGEQCMAITTSGERCRNPAGEGGYCWMHEA